MRKRLLLSVLLLALAFICKAQPVTITPPSANIQPGESVTLTASGALYYQWSPATGLSTTDGPVTVASPMVTTTYTCSGYAPGAESVVNGDFSQGNTGFTSAYEYNSNLWGEGTYFVDNDASLHHESFFGLGHGGGKFMIVNGATSPGTNVWTEQISVNPNTYYAFSTWVCTLAGQANEVARLQFSINGNQIGDIFTAPPERYVWEQFYELWYSDNATSATITILNQNTVGSGNDFGLDDISFCELVLVGAPECTVSVGSMSASADADDSELCAYESTTLHALPVGGSGNYTYSWTPANSLDNPSAQHPVATPPVGTTTYTCHVVDVDWNNTQDVSVTLMVYSPNEIILDPHDICVDSTLTWIDGNEYDQNGTVAYYDSIDSHGCLQVYKLELTVGEYQTPSDYDPNVYRCVPHGETAFYHWDVANRDYYGNAVDSVVVSDPAGGCDFKYRLNLQFHEEFYQVDTIERCGEYYWPITDLTYYESDTITKKFEENFGTEVCYKTYVLYLTINDPIVDPPPMTVSGGCDSVAVTPWPGHEEVYFYENTSSTGFTFMGETEEGCYREQTVIVDNMKYSPTPDTIRPSSGSTPYFSLPESEDSLVSDTAMCAAVVTNTEFFSFQYTFYVKETNSKCVWESCNWAISKPSWSIDYGSPKEGADGKYYSECTVYVADRDNDYVALTAIIGTGCDSDTCKIYLKSSFLDVEEQPASQSDFSIVPNPNNGQMKLLFNQFVGTVDVKVYDVMGHLLDSFETFNDSDTRTMEYNLMGRKGIFFFVVNGKEGTVAKKVVIR